MRILLLLLISVLASCSNEDVINNNTQLRVATAANMQFAIKEIARKFTAQTDIKCDIIVGSSGKLTAQIEEGAPYDVFISANMMYPQRLVENKKTIGKTKVYAHGKLVMWTLKDGIELNYETLKSPTIKHIAVANPETAPYGKAALEVLKQLPYFDSIVHKFVYGESISQTNQFIVTTSAEVGFTALSVVLSPEINGKGRWIEVDTALYSPIQQGAVIIDTQNSASQKFLDFLSSSEARKILAAYGYEIIN